jgi:hypothetical protein
MAVRSLATSLPLCQPDRRCQSTFRLLTRKNAIRRAYLHPVILCVPLSQEWIAGLFMILVKRRRIYHLSATFSAPSLPKPGSSGHPFTCLILGGISGGFSICLGKYSGSSHSDGAFPGERRREQVGFGRGYVQVFSKKSHRTDYPMLEFHGDFHHSGPTGVP